MAAIYLCNCKAVRKNKKRSGLGELLQTQSADGIKCDHCGYYVVARTDKPKINAIELDDHPDLVYCEYGAVQTWLSKAKVWRLREL